MTIRDISNFIQVSERIASSGQPEDKQLKLIASADYMTVINKVMLPSWQPNKIWQQFMSIEANVLR